MLTCWHTYYVGCGGVRVSFVFSAALAVREGVPTNDG
jgi:hypothetical protein